MRHAYTRLMVTCSDALERDVIDWVKSQVYDVTYRDMSAVLHHCYDLTVSPETLRRWLYWHRTGR